MSTLFKEQAAAAQYRRLLLLRDKVTLAIWQSKLGSHTDSRYVLDSALALVDKELDRVFPPPRSRKKKPARPEEAA